MEGTTAECAIGLAQFVVVGCGIPAFVLWLMFFKPY
jgi:hypothetical protein